MQQQKITKGKEALLGDNVHTPGNKTSVGEEGTRKTDPYATISVKKERKEKRKRKERGPSGKRSEARGRGEVERKGKGERSKGEAKC